MLLQNFFRLFKRCADGNGDQVRFGHYRADELSVVFFKTQIAIGQDTREPRPARNGKSGDAVLRSPRPWPRAPARSGGCWIPRPNARGS